MRNERSLCDRLIYPSSESELSAARNAAWSEIERLRAALERIEDASNLVKWEGLRAQAGLALKAIHDEASAALSGERPSPAEPTARRSGELLPCENCGHGIVAHVQNGGNCPTPPLKSGAES